MSSSRAVVPPAVLAKLFFFMGALLVAPIATYFTMYKRIYPGDSTYSAIAAVVVANMVIAGYILVAIYESDAEADDAKKTQTKEMLGITQQGILVEFKKTK